jgi:hypothetical protein
MVGTTPACHRRTTRISQVHHWVFDSEGHARLAIPEVLTIQISLRQSADDQAVDITQRSCTTSHRTLGVHENHAGNYQTEYAHLVNKGQKMAYLISAQSITRSDAWTAYRSIYLPSMNYSIPTTRFSRQEFATIQRSPIHSPIRVLLSATNPGSFFLMQLANGCLPFATSSQVWNVSSRCPTHTHSAFVRSTTAFSWMMHW